MEGDVCKKSTETNNDGFVQRWNKDEKEPDYRNVRPHSFRYLQRSTLSPKWRQDTDQINESQASFLLAEL